MTLTPRSRCQEAIGLTGCGAPSRRFSGAGAPLPAYSGGSPWTTTSALESWMRDKAGRGFVSCAFIEDDGDKRCSTGSSALLSALARQHGLGTGNPIMGGRL